MKYLVATAFLAAMMVVAAPARAGNSQGGNNNNQGGNNNNQGSGGGTVVAPEINPAGAVAVATLLTGAVALMSSRRRPA
jgi:hypothetical protein